MNNHHAGTSQYIGMIPFSIPPSPTPDFYFEMRRQRPKKPSGPAREYLAQPSAVNEQFPKEKMVARSCSREISITKGLSQLSLRSPSQSEKSGDAPPCVDTPSFLPKPVAKDFPSTPMPQQDSRYQQQEIRSVMKEKTSRFRYSLSLNKTPQFLTKSSNMKLAPVDMESRFEAMDKQLATVRAEMSSATDERSKVQEQLDLFQTRGEFDARHSPKLKQ